VLTGSGRCVIDANQAGNDDYVAAPDVTRKACESAFLYPLVMSDQAAQSALDRMETDDSFAERVKDAGGREASLQVLQAEGFDVTPEEMRDATLDRYAEKLNPEQLEAFSAGADPAANMAVWLAGGAAIAGTVIVSAAAAAV
jgi:predicted ribosomally synthesized peptide with nif11-like leader